MKAPIWFGFLVVGKATSKMMVLIIFFSPSNKQKKSRWFFTSNFWERKVGQKTRTRWNRCHDEEILQSETILNCRSVQGADILFHSWSEMLAAHFWQTANKLWSMLIQSETSGNSLLYNVRLKMEETLSEPTISWKQYSGYNYSLFEMLIYMVSSGVASK